MNTSPNPRPVTALALGIPADVAATAAGLAFDLKQNGKNLAGDKETHRTAVVLAVDSEGRVYHAVTVRCYSGRSRNATTHYASVWISGPNAYGSGHGRASGYGYHKDSAAVADAFRSAGVYCLPNFGGAGDSAIRDATLAVAVALGLTPIAYVEG